MQTITEWYFFSMSTYDARQNGKINALQQREHRCLQPANDPFLFLITALTLLESLKITFPAMSVSRGNLFSDPSLGKRLESFSWTVLMFYSQTEKNLPGYWLAKKYINIKHPAKSKIHWKCYFWKKKKKKSVISLSLITQLTFFS